MAIRVQFLTFQKDDLKALIENKFPKLREWILNSAEEDIDDWNIETIDFFENNEQIKNLEELKEVEVSRVVVSFFDYLERGKSKIKRKYSKSLLTLKMYQEDFQIVEQFGSKNLQNYFKFIIEGRSFKDKKSYFKQIENESHSKIGFLSKNERDFIVNEIENNFKEIIKGTSIENLITEFKEIGTNYQQVIILIS